MKPYKFKKILSTTRDLLMFIKSMNSNAAPMKKHMDTFNVLYTKLEGYQAQHTDKEYMESLSGPEKNALRYNTQSYYETLQEVKKELDYLDMSKYPLQLSNAMYYLERFNILGEHVLENDILEDGKIAYSDFTNINPKKFESLSYKTQAVQVEAEFKALVIEMKKLITNTKADTVYPELLGIQMLVILYSDLCLSSTWASKEVVRCNTEKEPEIKEIQIPKEVSPEIPKSPQPETSEK